MLLDILIPYYGDKDVIKSMVSKIFEAESSLHYIRIVIVDNCSESNLEPEFVDKYGPNLVYIRNETNLGRIGNWNKALDYIESDWYCFLFLGDMLTNIPELLSEIMKVNNQCRVLSYRMTMRSDKENKLIGKYILNRYGVHDGNRLIERYLPLGLMPWGPLQTNVFRKECAENSKFDASDDYYADIKYILSAIDCSTVKIIKSTHLEWLVNKDRTHFQISLADFITKDLRFITNVMKYKFGKRLILKSCLSIRAVVMARHYGFSESLKAIYRILRA